MVKPIRFKDKEGVEYFITINGVVFLELPKDKGKKKKKYRKIGHFDRHTKIFTKFEKNNPDAVFIKFNSFGFPYHLLKFLYEKFGLRKIIVKVSDWKKYEIEAEKLFEKGFFEEKFLNFKRKGYELRLYVPIKYFQKIEGVSYEG